MTKKSIHSKEEKQNVSRNYLLFFLYFIFSLVIFYFFSFSNKSGVVGPFLYHNFFYLFGEAIYFIPLCFFIFSFRFLDKSKINYFLFFLGFVFLLIFSSILFDAVFQNLQGGIFGRELVKLSFFLVGKTCTFLLAFCFILIGFYLINVAFIQKIFFLLEKSFALILKVLRNFVRLKKAKKPEKLETQPKQALDPEKKENFDIKNEKDLNFLETQNSKFLKNVETQNEQNVEQINLIKEFENLDTKKIDKDLSGGEKNFAEENLNASLENLDNEKEYVLPSIDLLDKPQNNNITISEKILKENAAILHKTLQDFGIAAAVTDITPGPVITRYEIELEPGVKVSSIISLKNDICLAMKTQNIMLIAPIPGKSAIGIEIPNHVAQPVVFRDIVDSKEFRASKTFLPFAIGKTVSGRNFLTDIVKTPHLLIAGATGSGKSVCINTLIMSILYSKKPDEVKFIMVDPKVVELTYYQNIPHLYSPVITHPKEASKVLQQVVFLMEKRYQTFAEEGVRNIESYNQKMMAENRQKEFYLIVIIDELADLMLTCPKDVEESIVRLTQKARAVGIHVVLATQRPSVDVITGIIKANLPSRASFQVMSKTDSRVVLDTNGAEDLLGRGDMLFLENGAAKPIRLQGAFLSEQEVKRVTDFVKTQRAPDYFLFNQFNAQIFEQESDELGSPKNKNFDEDLKRALNLILERRKISYELMRANGFGGPKTTNLISLMQTKGFIEKPAGSQKWEIDFEAIERYFRDN